MTFPIFDEADISAAASPFDTAAWATVLASYPGDLPTHLLGVMRHGIKIGYTGPLRQHGRSSCNNLPRSENEREAVKIEVKKRVDLGSFIPPRPDHAFVASPLGAVPKPPAPDGSLKFRVIHHLSHPRKRHTSVNDGIASELVTLTYETLEPLFAEASAYAQRGQPMEIWKVDFADAFRHVVTCCADCGLNGCIWEGDRWVDSALPFGLRSSPFLFNLFSEAFHWILESIGVRHVHHYLDDFFGLAPRGQSQSTIKVVLEACRILGWQISPNKVAFGPSLPLLGVLIDLDQGIASITTERRAILFRDISRILNKGSASRLTLQSMAGSLLFVTRVCPTGRAFLRRLFDAASLHQQGSAFQHWRLPPPCKDELLWWRSTLQTWDGTHLFLQPVHAIEVWTDASGEKGFGGHLGPRESCLEAFSERLPKRHRDKDIQFKEALAVLHACNLWSHDWSGCRVTFRIDNEAVFWALRTGRIRSPSTQSIIRQIFTSAASRHFSFAPHWIGTKENFVADALSRHDWSQIPLRLHPALHQPTPPAPYHAPLLPTPLSLPPAPSSRPFHPIALQLPHDVDLPPSSKGSHEGTTELVVLARGW